jgi:tetratricopeptide (TPR) repeat protein
MTTHQFIAGDIGYFTHTDGFVHPFKLLVVSEADAAKPTWHLSFYTPQTTPITETDIPHLVVATKHVPIAAFPETAVFVGHVEVTSEDKAGYFEYLRQTDFRAYVAKAGVDVKALVAEAQTYYQQGYELTSQKQPDEAIAAYTKAIDHFPLFVEAFDNRAFVYMDRGEWEPAMKDFRQSLAIEPTFLAQFSLAECLCKAGNYTAAQVELEKAKTLGDDPQVALLEVKINQGLKIVS